MKFLFSLIIGLSVSLCADVEILLLGELGSVRYTSDDQHLLQVERLSPSDEIMYTHSYRYDESGKLTSESLIGNLGEVVYESNGVVKSPFSLEVCEYDENHNLIKHTLNGISKEYTYNKLNQIIPENVEQLCLYDSFGNVLQRGEDQFIYDDENNLSKVITPNCLVEYSYNRFGKRASRTINEDTEYYIYFGNNEMAIFDRNSQIKELRIPGLSIHKDILRPIAIESNHTIYAPIHDVQGNIIQLIDLFNREVITIEHVDPFGKGLPDNVPTSWIFAGKYYDKEAGLVYFGERYYCPELRAWLSPDPMKQNSNPYQYCLNNPFSYYDPDGAFAFAVPLVGLTWGAGVTITAPIWAPYALAAAAGATVGYWGYKAYDHWQKKTEEPPYNGKDLGEDASKRPAKGFEWKGKGDPKTGRGAWYNPDTEESLHPDFNHKGNMKPHWDYIGPDGKEARIFTDGTWVWK